MTRRNSVVLSWEVEPAVAQSPFRLWPAARAGPRRSSHDDGTRRPRKIHMQHVGRSHGQQPLRFDAVVIGVGMFSGYCADKIFRFGTNNDLKVLVLEAGPFMVATHPQNLPRAGINVPGSREGCFRLFLRESLWRAPERLRQPKGQMRIARNRRGAFQILHASQSTFLQADTFLSRAFALLHHDPPSPPKIPAWIF